mmetsp:Transcript_2097/g.3242  ORF Transcript_2097/g.3242 Transcript_2097/m.3242 type:complete len:80 (-) Transcript_2097:58-297(-)
MSRKRTLRSKWRRLCTTPKLSQALHPSLDVVPQVVQTTCLSGQIPQRLDEARHGLGCGRMSFLSLVAIAFAASKHVSRC